MTSAFRLSLCVAVTAFLTNCNQADPVANAGANTTNIVAAAPVTEPAAAPAATPAAAASGELSADFLLGKWTAMGDCKDVVEFRKDGVVMTPIGPGKWTLVGDQLTITPDGADKQTPTTISRVDDKTISTLRGTGKPDLQHRC